MKTTTVMFSNDSTLPWKTSLKIASTFLFALHIFSVQGDFLTVHTHTNAHSKTLKYVYCSNLQNLGHCQPWSAMHTCERLPENVNIFKNNIIPPSYFPPLVLVFHPIAARSPRRESCGDIFEFERVCSRSRKMFPPQPRKERVRRNRYEAWSASS